MNETLVGSLSEADLYIFSTLFDTMFDHQHVCTRLYMKRLQSTKQPTKQQNRDTYVRGSAIPIRSDPRSIPATHSRPSVSLHSPSIPKSLSYPHSELAYGRHPSPITEACIPPLLFGVSWMGSFWLFLPPKCYTPKM